MVVLIKADCPLGDLGRVDKIVRRFKTAGVENSSNISPPTYPDGLNIEVCTFKALEPASQVTNKPYDHEHLTSYVRESGRFSTAAIQHSQDLSSLSWTVDEGEDFAVIEKIFQHFHPLIDFS